MIDWFYQSSDDILIFNNLTLHFIFAFNLVGSGGQGLVFDWRGWHACFLPGAPFANTNFKPNMGN